MGIYKLSKDASQKLEEIYEYSLSNFGIDKADEYYYSLHETFSLLSDQPHLGRKFHEFYRHEHGFHVFFYQVTNYGILILHIFHQKQNISDMFQ